jgi:DNA polymerase-1
MRRRAKAVNFGVIYGQSPFGLARSLRIDREEAARFIDDYFGRYPGVERFLSRTLAECHDTGYVKTILGRRRAIRGVRRGGSRGLSLPERTAVNTVIQGSAADLIKLAMIAIHDRLREEHFRAGLLLQIHDELVFEVPPEELDVMAALVREQMCGVLQLVVPLAVDLQSGENWAECEPWKS